MANRATGYSLWIEDNQQLLRVVNGLDVQIRFRTVDQALDEQVDIP
jgi:hypothetical protein